MCLIVNKIGVYETANPGIHSRLFGNWGCIIGLLRIGLACALIRIKVLNCTVTVHLRFYSKDSRILASDPKTSCMLAGTPAPSWRLTALFCAVSSSYFPHEPCHQI